MQRRRWLRVGFVVALTSSIAGVASSNSGGRTGSSGKQGATCTSCHQGGVTPKVELTGPTSLDAGMVAIYTFRIETDAAITGMNAAASDGLLTENTDAGFTRSEDGEIVHGRTLRPDGGAAIYTFSMTAPEFGGTVTLFAAGNACDNNGQTDGDEAAGAKIDIAVNGPPRPPPPEAVPPPVKPPPPPPPAEPDAGSDAGVVAAPREDSGGCSMGPDRTSPLAGFLGALVAIAALVRGRRARRRR